VRLAVITGSDLTAQLVARAAEQHLTIALIGPTAEACTVLRSKYPGLNVVSHVPPVGFIRSEHQIQKCVDFVVKNRPPLIFLALGMPQQEILAGHIADHPHTRGVGLCIGASIDFLTGKQPRAPVSFQKAGLEWLYRLLSDPRRLASRYLIECPRIFYYCLKETSVFAREGVAGFMATGAVLAPLSAVVLQNLGFGALYGICLTVVWLSMSQAAYVVGMTYLQARAR
jgi:exopolysaccharide biosynthesis WecB/TagA/CpsF family protein